MDENTSGASETATERRGRLNREAAARYRARQRGQGVPFLILSEPTLPACEYCEGEIPPKTGRGGGHPKKFCSPACKSAANNIHPDRRWRYVRTRYGLDKSAHDALLEAQGGRCAICRTDDPKSPHWNVDHCHKTNVVRGLLCLTCNSGIGMLNDDPDLLRAAALYLLKRAHIDP